MKTTVIFNVAASSGGALTILNQIHEKSLSKEGKWIFIVSTPLLSESENVKVLRFPWIKKSWFHRMWFKIRYEKKIIKRYKYADFVSLENVGLRTKKKHTIYLHNALVFSTHKISFFKNFKLWFYDKITKFRIKRSLTGTKNNIVVQTKWMKEYCLSKFNLQSKQVKIVSPEVSLDLAKYEYKKNNSKMNFFYPSANFQYKNHLIIIEALKLIKNKKNLNFIFTITESEAPRMYKEIVKYSLPVNLVGKLNYEEVLSYYANSVLIFPSYLESFGLPLLEAKTIGSPIIAGDFPFVHEILSEYSKKIIVDVFDAESVKNAILEVYNEK